MKKAFLLIAALVVGVSTGALAQYEKGDLTLNAGISFGLIGYGYGLYGSSSGMPPLTLNVEYSPSESFAIGPYAGMYTRSYSYGVGYNDKFTALSFGVRGTFHATPILNELLNLDLNEEKVDLYGTLILGFETYSWKYDDQFVGSNYYSNGSRLIFGPVVGVRYFLTPNFGLFFEGGRGAFGYGTLGVTGKF